MKPFIKWPGGKAGEIDQFEYLIPAFDRYIEPFVGGGALYFHLNPVHALINDTSRDLMDLYVLVQRQDEELHRLLSLYCKSFSALKEACRFYEKDLLDLFALYRLGAEREMDLKKLRLHLGLAEEIGVKAVKPVAEDLILNWEEYAAALRTGLQDKLQRTLAHDQKRRLSEQDLAANLTTGFTGGFYMYFRSVFNAIRSAQTSCTNAYRAANFYFIREYCYGSMFRYNAAGQFNIPYGGISYNKKDFDTKVGRMFRPDMAALLGRTELYCLDFEEFLDSLTLTEQDFLFLDPPYDTEFSDYEGQSFDLADQRRLAHFLYGTKARFLLVIKNTESIYALYRDHFRILSFENRYTYNVRSRNERKAEHLIVTNIPEDQVPWVRENVLL